MLRSFQSINRIQKSVSKVSVARFSSSNEITVDVGDAFATHSTSCSPSRSIAAQSKSHYFSHFPDCEMPSSLVKTTKEELLLYFKQMYTMRRMEITNDTEYKVTKFDHES
jgi:hypothetical protein